jgi:methyl-accepting chemotaxis protein
VAAVKEISGTITEINHISSTIAAAMEQQSAATQEISRNVIETSKAAQEVSSRIAMASQEADQTGSQAAHVRQGSSEVASSIEELRHVLVAWCGRPRPMPTVAASLAFIWMSPARP